MTAREQQFAYLQAMGIQAWRSRVAEADEIPAEVAQKTQTQPVDDPRADLPANDVARQTSKAALKAMLGDVSKPTKSKPAAWENPPVASMSPISDSSAEASVPTPPLMDGEEPPMPTDEFMPGLDMSEMDAELAPAPTIDVSKLDWPELQSAVSACTACELHRSRTQTVFGAGSRVAEWMIIGEAPGAEEDQQGQPFVGPSGQLLNNMLRALGLEREQVFVSNILKCRPADDRDPTSEEVGLCEAYLQRQIALVAPKLILAVGGIAAHSLLKVKTPVTKLRGELHHYGETPLVVTYHPAYLLRKPSEKAKSWDDLKFAASVVRGGLS